MYTYLKIIRPLLIVFVLGGVFGSISRLFLFLRPTPFGLPYVLDNSHYLYHALFYEWYGIALLSLPFFLIPLLLGKSIRQPNINILAIGQIILITLSLVIGIIDHELQRFMGTKLTWDFISTYVNTGVVPESIWKAIQTDKGGPYSSVGSLIIAVMFIVSAFFLYRRPISFSIPKRASMFLLIAGIAWFYVLPFFFRTPVFGGKNRQQKVKPPVITVANELGQVFLEKPTWDNIDNQIVVAQSKWTSVDNGDWEFVSKDYPFYKKRTTKCPTQKRQWNVIVIVLETFRAMNMKSFNPKANVEATPFMDKVAQGSVSGDYSWTQNKFSAQSAYWPRFVSNGQPTVVSFMAIQTGLIPHSSKTVAKSFTTTQMDSLPNTLKRHGYQTSFFTGSDPDWDNQRNWLNHWYDHVYFNPDDEEQDRRVFRAAAKYLKDSMHENQPFYSMVFSISNHVPFESPEPELNLVDDDNLKNKIHNTMRYTDNVVQEFIHSISQEPWFENTVVLITGDHGYDLGERGTSTGHINARHETNWVPLIVFSGHPRQPSGKQRTLGSHVDIAPTVLDMLGICDDNSFMGHSLLTKKPQNAYTINVKKQHFGLETADYSFYFPQNAAPFVYAADDQLQATDLFNRHRDTAERNSSFMFDMSNVVDYMYVKNRIIPKDVAPIQVGRLDSH